jgi:two-component system, sensor histidine kinase
MRTTQNHEIRTPLVGVLGMSDILLLQRDLPATIATQLRIIHDSGNALLAIVNSILDVSKLYAGMVRVDLRVRTH